MHTDRLLVKALGLLEYLVQQVQHMSSDLSSIQVAVSAETDAVKAAVTLLTDLAARLEAAKADPAQVQALADQIRANSDALSAAVVANTPSA
jgi:hypothetical protein